MKGWSSILVLGS